MYTLYIYTKFIYWSDHIYCSFLYILQTPNATIYFFFSNNDFQINLFRNIIEWIRGNGVGGNPSDFETTEPWYNLFVVVSICTVHTNENCFVYISREKNSENMHSWSRFQTSLYSLHYCRGWFKAADALGSIQFLATTDLR